ncbi:hypothetical protein B0J17DRAFT_631378 [Rhizoctonia solani]|nr:hypothetical protein B0J17DRAFT_631378 [Rhizoctonia solani]
MGQTDPYPSLEYIHLGGIRIDKRWRRNPIYRCIRDLASVWPNVRTLLMPSQSASVKELGEFTTLPSLVHLTLNLDLKYPYFPDKPSFKRAHLKTLTSSGPVRFGIDYDDISLCAALWPSLECLIWSDKDPIRIELAELFNAKVLGSSDHALLGLDTTIMIIYNIGKEAKESTPLQMSTRIWKAALDDLPHRTMNITHLYFSLDMISKAQQEFPKYSRQLLTEYNFSLHTNNMIMLQCGCQFVAWKDEVARQHRPAWTKMLSIMCAAGFVLSVTTRALGTPKVATLIFSSECLPRSDLATVCLVSCYVSNLATPLLWRNATAEGLFGLIASTEFSPFDRGELNFIKYTIQTPDGVTPWRIGISYGQKYKREVAHYFLTSKCYGS